MIKVNMLRNMGIQGGGGGALGGLGASTAESNVSSELQRQAAIKVFIIILFPVALFAYEKINLSNLEAELKVQQALIDQINAEKAAFGSVAPRVEKYTKEKKEIEKQVEVVRELTKNRLREVKTLDVLQSLMPEQTWLKEINIAAGVVTIQGFTSADEGVSKLMKALEGSVLFSQIIPKTTARVDLAGVSANRFTFEFRVGKQE